MIGAGIVAVLAAGALAVPAHAEAAVAPSTFTPLTPTRVLDTRVGEPVGPGGTVAVDLPQVLDGATAVALNVTGIGAANELGGGGALVEVAGA